MTTKNPVIIGLTAVILAILIFSGGISSSSIAQKLGLKNPVTILTYNHIREVTEKNFDTLYYSVSPENFAWQISHLKHQNFQIVNLNQSPNPRPKTVILTFSNAYSDFTDFAWPILQQNQLSATVFYQPDNIGKPGYLSQDQVIQLQKQGVDFQNFSQSPPQSAKAEVSGVIRQDQFFDLLPTPKLESTFAFTILSLTVLIFAIFAFTNPPYAIALITLALPAYLLRFSLFGLPTNLVEVFILITTISWILSKPQFLLFKTSFKWPIILLLLAGLISVIISPEKFAAAGYFRAFFFVPVLFALIVSDTIKTRKQVTLLFSAFVTSATIIAIYALFRYFSGQGYVDFNLTLLPTFFGNPNYLASYLAPALIFSTFLLINNLRNKKPTIPFVSFVSFASFASFVSLIPSLLLTRSQGAWLGLATAFLWILSRLFKLEKLFFLGTVTTVILLIIFYALVSQNIILKGKNSISSRVGMYQTSFAILHNSPILGTGLANFQPVYQRYVQPDNPEQNPLTSHNTYLDFWLQTGILGPISFSLIIINFFKVSLKTGKQNILALILSAAMVSFLIHSLFDTQYLKNDYALIFWLIIGLTVALDKKIGLIK